MRYRVEACSPYDTGNSSEPVCVWDIIDRLSREDLRSLAMAFATHDPVWFEDKLMRLPTELPYRISTSS